MTTRVAALAVALLTLSSDSAFAQAPERSVTHPRLYRLLEVVTEPAVVFNPRPYPGYAPSDRPLLDAAPNLFRLASLGVSLANSAALGWATSFVPTGLRLLRVALYGLPFPTARGEVALWVAAPNLFRARRNYEATGRLFTATPSPRPVACRTLFPRLHGRRR